MIYKSINPQNIKITPFEAFKNYSINSTIDSGGVTIYKGKFDNINFSISDTNDPVNANIEYTANDKIQQLVYQSLYTLFYEDYNIKPIEKLGSYYLSQKRNISDFVYALSIPYSLTIEGVKESSISLTISDSTSGSIINLYDDGKGNLIDIAKETLSKDSYDPIMPHVISEINFNECYLYNNIQFHSIKSNVSVYNQEYVYNDVILDNSQFRNNGVRKDLTFNSNFRGYYGEFNGSGSFIRLPNNDLYNFKQSDDFALTFLIKTTDSNKNIINKNNSFLETVKTQQINLDGQKQPRTSDVETLIEYNHYPFHVNINSSGYLEAKRSDGNTTLTLTSSTIINDDTWKSIIVQKYDDTFELIINGVLEDSIADTCNNNIITNCDLIIGKYNETYFSGELDEIKLFRIGLTQTQYYDLAVNELNYTWNYYAGNIFYKHGFITLTNPYYKNLNTDFDFLLNFKSTKTIYEHEYVCKTEGHEFNMTLNPTVRTPVSLRSDNLNPIYNVDTFTTFVTSIGLYNNYGDLLAIAKLSRPIPKFNNSDLSFVVRFDI